MIRVGSEVRVFPGPPIKKQLIKSLQELPFKFIGKRWILREAGLKVKTKVA